ncbi:MAG: site-specific DNA-methyltransferase [Planctomycetota bacterium]
MKIEIHNGDCLEILRAMPSAQVDLVYLDPPFFTQREHRMKTRDSATEFSFDDKWGSATEYTAFLDARLIELHRTLKPTGSIFFHCDKTASHIARLLMDNIFESDNFRAEIIWHYKRWSNSAKGLLPAHQSILFYSKTADYKFHTILTDYSLTTNVDQILQKRSRDKTNKSVYARDENGDVVYSGPKNGVPLSDVWTIPFLNPKAKERTGYPTQKPILLLERIIELVTDIGDLVLDPFCGSGTSLVAAKLFGRKGIGIDISAEACALSRKRIDDPIRTESQLLKVGINSYRNANANALALLNGIPHIPVQRNNGIDAFLKATFEGAPIPVRVQKHGEILTDAAFALHKAGSTKNAKRMILIATEDVASLWRNDAIPTEIVVVDSASLSIKRLFADITSDQKATKWLHAYG